MWRVVDGTARRMNGTVLGRDEFRNAARLRYGLCPIGLPKCCDGCGARFTVEHALVVDELQPLRELADPAAPAPTGFLQPELGAVAAPPTPEPVQRILPAPPGLVGVPMEDIRSLRDAIVELTTVMRDLRMIIQDQHADSSSA